MKKLLHVITDSGIGGAGVLLMNLFRHLDLSRYQPVLVLSPGSALCERARELGIRYVELAVHADCSFSLSDIAVLVSFFRVEKPDILHTHACLSARIAGLLSGVPHAVDTKHCAYALSPLAGSLPLRLAMRALDALSDARHIATARVAKDLLVRKGVCERRISTIPGGSEPVEKLSHEEKCELRASLGLSACDFAVGYAARLERGKGHEVLLSAARLLVAEPHIHILIVGTGSMESELRSEAAGLSRVHFLGFRPDIWRVMNLFDVNINCSYLSETSSLALSEGMSLGLPLIVTDCGGNPDMARDCGLTVPCRDSRALAEAILRLHRDKVLYASLSEASRRRFATSYTAEAMTRATERVYEEF